MCTVVKANGPQAFEMCKKILITNTMTEYLPKLLATSTTTTSHQTLATNVHTIPTIQLFSSPKVVAFFKIFYLQLIISHFLKNIYRYKFSIHLVYIPMQTTFPLSG